ncbi:acyl-CoA thioesterase [Schlesneria paludicola]|uniref:acyl-CoA thioesterase n=1 Tax=Schlesneria paludicola TaxID=360056 RepID=UPI00029AB364|nr:thioesterase family protein [Schlesneria paludicola]
MPAIFEWKHVVVERDLDDLGHANNISYLHWMQSAALAHSAAQGWPVEAYQSLGHGWVVRSHHIEYLSSARLGDEIVIRTFVANMRKVTSLRRFQMIRLSDAAVVARAETDWAFIEYATGTPKRIPAEVISAFEIVAEAA